MSYESQQDGLAPNAARLLACAVVGFVCTLFLFTPARADPELVNFRRGYAPGAIVISNRDRQLFYVLADGLALRYRVSIGRAGSQWTGTSFVLSKARNPDWTPVWAPGYYVRGGPGNPLGARALYLGWTLYRIHGTNSSTSIGEAVSHGCFRMLNRDVIDLYDRVHIGAPVYVLDSLPRN